MKMCTKSLGLFYIVKVSISLFNPPRGKKSCTLPSLSLSFFAYLDINVEMANAVGVILGIVAKNPLLKLNGNGQKRIAVRYNSPSLRMTWPRAMKRGSPPTHRSTTPPSTVLLATNAARLPSVHAAEAIGQPRGKPYTKPATVLAVE